MLIKKRKQISRLVETLFGFRKIHNEIQNELRKQIREKEKERKIDLNQFKDLT